MNIELMLDILIIGIFAFFASLALVRGAQMFSLVRELRVSEGAGGFVMFAGSAPASSSALAEEVEDSGPPIPSHLLGGHNGRGERRSRLERRRVRARMRARGV